MKGWLRVGLLAAGSIGLLIGALMVSGASPAETLRTLWTGSFGSAQSVTGTLRETAPLLILGLAVFIGIQAGLFNIGAEGQFVVGGLVGAAIQLNVSGWFGLVLALLGASVAGALWAFPAGWIRAYRGAHEVITTIMLNSVASLLAAALVVGPLRDKAQESSTTAVIGAASRLDLISIASSGSGWSLGIANPADPAIPPSGGWILQISFAILIGVGLILVVGHWLYRSVAGFEWRMVGAGTKAAETAGVLSKRVIVAAMAASGALSGLAGALQVAAFEGRFYDGFSPGYGFDALGVALLAGGNVFGLFPAALLFGALNKGATSIAILGVPKGITGVLLGLLIIIAASIRYRKAVRHG